MIRGTLFALLLAGVAQAAPVQYRLDPAKSTLDARVYKAGIASGLAHDHVIRAANATGTVTYDASAANAWSIEVTVPTADLQVDPWRARQSYRLPGDIDDDDRKEIEAHMRAKDQLATDQHPTITFKSTRIRRSGEGEYQVDGDLTLRGVTKPVTLTATIRHDEKGFVGEGKLRITHAQFGFKPYSAALGAVKNQEKIDLVLKIVATAAP